MIPFKPTTTNGYVALLILICLSENCASHRASREESRVRIQKPLQAIRQTSRTILHDVRADSRQSRIDSSDIRTDFREIRTELPSRSPAQSFNRFDASERSRIREANRRISEASIIRDERRTIRENGANGRSAIRNVREARSDFSRNSEGNRRVSDRERLAGARQDRAQIRHRTIEVSNRQLSQSDENRRQADDGRLSSNNAIRDTIREFPKTNNSSASDNSLITALQAILLVALLGQLLGNTSKANPIRSWPIFAKVH